MIFTIYVDVCKGTKKSSFNIHDSSLFLKEMDDK